MMVVMIVLGVLSLASIAWAQPDYPPTPPPPNEVLGGEEGKGSVGSSGGAVLPFTGGDLMLFVAAGAGLSVLGVVVYRRARSRFGAG